MSAVCFLLNKNLFGYARNWTLDACIALELNIENSDEWHHGSSKQVSQRI